MTDDNYGCLPGPNNFRRILVATQGDDMPFIADKPIDTDDMNDKVLRGLAAAERMPDDFNPNAPEPAPEPYPPEMDATAILDRLLAHFQLHRIDDVPAVIAVLEAALDSEYRRGVEEAASMTRRTKSILDTPLPEWGRYEQHPMTEPTVTGEGPMKSRQVFWRSLAILGVAVLGVAVLLGG